MLSSHQALAGARGQLYATLFTCDGRGDAGLLWLHEAEGAGRAEWEAAFRTARYLPRAPAHDVRTVVWNGDLCWTSSGCVAAAAAGAAAAAAGTRAPACAVGLTA